MARRANDNGLLRLPTGASEFAARVRMTEIDDNVAAVDLFRDVVTEIQTGGYRDDGAFERGACVDRGISEVDARGSVAEFQCGRERALLADAEGGGNARRRFRSRN